MKEFERERLPSFSDHCVRHVVAPPHGSELYLERVAKDNKNKIIYIKLQSYQIKLARILNKKRKKRY